MSRKEHVPLQNVLLKSHLINTRIPQKVGLRLIKHAIVCKILLIKGQENDSGLNTIFAGQNRKSPNGSKTSFANQI